MQLGIDFSQPSTVRGVITIIAALVLGVGVLLGKDIPQIISVFSLFLGANGAAGVFVKDKNEK